MSISCSWTCGARNGPSCWYQPTSTNYSWWPTASSSCARAKWSRTLPRTRRVVRKSGTTCSGGRKLFMRKQALSGILGVLAAFAIGALLLALQGFNPVATYGACLLYTSDAADDLLCVDLGGRRIIKKKKKKNIK